MKRIIFILLAVVLALTACTKSGGKKHETALPQLKDGYIIYEGNRHEELAVKRASIDVKMLQQGKYELFFSPGLNIGYEELFVSLPTEHAGETVDLTKVDPLSSSKNKYYSIEYYNRKLACGDHTNPVLAKEGSYLRVTPGDNESFDTELTLKNGDGYAASLKYNGQLLPFFITGITDGGEIYLDGSFYTITAIDYTKNNNLYTVNFKSGSALTVTIKVEEFNTGWVVDLSKQDPVVGQSGKTPYQISYTKGSSSAVTLAWGAASSSGGKYGMSGSTMEMFFYSDTEVWSRISLRNASHRFALSVEYMNCTKK